MVDEVYNFVNRAVKGSETVLNLCAGKNRSRLIATEHKKIVHVDICEVWLDKENYADNEEKVVYDVTKINEKYQPKSFEAVICVEGVEHLLYDDGVKLVEDAERLAQRIVVFTTPNFFSTDTVLDGNQYNAHLSFFPPEFWKNRGYAITTFGVCTIAVKLL